MLKSILILTLTLSTAAAALYSRRSVTFEALVIWSLVLSLMLLLQVMLLID